MRNDPRTGNQDIWVVDLASGNGTAITNDVYPDNAPIWSPDGKHVAYVSTREGLAGIYRKAADGTGEAELLFQYTPGAGMVLTDWSPDGKFITFFTGVLVLVPVGTPGGRRAARRSTGCARTTKRARAGSRPTTASWPTSRTKTTSIAARSTCGRSIPPSPMRPPTGKAVRISKDGSIGMITWRQDGKELYFMTRDWEVMAVDITTTPTFTAGTPRMLFSLPGPLPGNPLQWKNVSQDGQRFIFAMPAAAASPSALAALRARRVSSGHDARVHRSPLQRQGGHRLRDR